MKFSCTVHPKKSDPWWPTCLGFDLEAPTATVAKANAWNMAIRAGMQSPRKVVAVKVANFNFS